MHEFGIVKNIIDILESEGNKYSLRRIKSFTIKLGKLRQCAPDFLKFAFETLAQNTIAAGAQMIIDIVPATIYCRRCRKDFAVIDNIYICPVCDNTDVELLTGKEIIVESLEGEK